MFNLLPSLFDKPLHIQFVEQEPEEKIELFLRQHGVTNIKWIITAVLLFLFPVAFIKLEEITGDTLLYSVPAKILIEFLIAWYMLVTAYVLEKYLYWYFNVYIVTTQNLVDINFYSLLSRSIVEIDLRDVESQSSSITGILGSLYNFGDVKVETAAETENVVFESVPNPDLVADRIEDLRNVVRKENHT